MDFENSKKERELVEKAQKDPEAFSHLYEDNYSKIFGYVLKRVADVSVAQDIVSETFFKAFKNIKSFKWKNISFSCWLYRIASNEISNYFRKNRYTPVCLDQIGELRSDSNQHDELVRAEEDLAAKKEFILISKKVACLPKKYQEVISLKFFEKKKIEEISQILGKKEDTVKSLIHRGIEKLRQIETF